MRNVGSGAEFTRKNFLRGAVSLPGASTMAHRVASMHMARTLNPMALKVKGERGAEGH